MQDLLKELKRYIKVGANTTQISDLCDIIISETNNLRLIRGAQAIKRRTLNNFNYDLAEREVNAMINSIKVF
jgi:hypothetical protein